MDGCNPILPPSPNIIDGKDDYIHHDVDDDFSPLSLLEVIQVPSPDSKAVLEEQLHDEDEDEDEDAEEDDDAQPPLMPSRSIIDFNF